MRKTWKDSKSQVGAYRILSNAKAAADKNPGTFVFANDGTAIYPANSTAEPDYRVHTVVKGDTLLGYCREVSRQRQQIHGNQDTERTFFQCDLRGWKLKIPN